MCRNLIVLACLLLPSGTLSAPKDPPLEIQADRIEVNQKNGHVRFEGHVRVQRGKLNLECGLMTARYQNGKLTEMKAEKSVRVRSEEFIAQAKFAHFDQRKNLLSLLGKPRLIRGKSTVTGQRILVWLNDERIVVEKAKGKIDPSLLRTFTKKHK